MSDSPFIKFYPSDFLAGTSGLSPAERGVYITLLCLIYEADGPIPRDDARLSRRCGAPKAAFIRILDGLTGEGKITDVDGMLSNRRAEKALMDRANRTQNSTHAANSRWSAQTEKTPQKQSADDAGAMPPQCVADASQKPEPEPIREDPPFPPSGGDGFGFEDFWKIVPKQAAKGAAERAYSKALKITDAATIFAAMRAYAESRAGKDEQFTAHPSAWLKARRWEDTPKPQDTHEATDEFQSALEEIRQLERARTERERTSRGGFRVVAGMDGGGAGA